MGFETVAFTVMSVHDLEFLKTQSRFMSQAIAIADSIPSEKFVFCEEGLDCDELGLRNTENLKPDATPSYIQEAINGWLRPGHSNIHNMFPEGWMRRVLWPWLPTYVETGDQMQVFVYNSIRMMVDRRPIQMRLGSFLAALGIHNSVVERLVSIAKAKTGITSDVKFACTADEIERVYADGPRSCMRPDQLRECWSSYSWTPDSPVRAYAYPLDRTDHNHALDNKLALAYLDNNSGRVVARTVVDVERKRYGRIYGEEVLVRALKRMDYQYDGDLAVGKRFSVVKGQPPNVYMLPYVDSNASAGFIYTGRNPEYFVYDVPGNHDKYVSKNSSGLCKLPVPVECHVCKKDINPSLTIQVRFNDGVHDICQTCSSSSRTIAALVMLSGDRTAAPRCWKEDCSAVDGTYVLNADLEELTSKCEKCERRFLKQKYGGRRTKIPGMCPKCAIEYDVVHNYREMYYISYGKVVRQENSTAVGIFPSNEGIEVVGYDKPVHALAAPQLGMHCPQCNKMVRTEVRDGIRTVIPHQCEVDESQSPPGRDAMHRLINHISQTIPLPDTINMLQTENERRQTERILQRAAIWGLRGPGRGEENELR